jgi:WD40 repeat protein
MCRVTLVCGCGRDAPRGRTDEPTCVWLRVCVRPQAVWDVAYMTDHAEFLASCSMDHNAKLWDLTVGRCRQTFRGHVDAINGITFQPYANVIATASGDKTLSLWDCRSGLCAQTFYGHKNACNSIAFKPQGEQVVSTDADGTVRLWDIRKVAEIACIRVSDHPANSAVFDPSGKALAVACDDSIVRCYDLESLAAGNDAQPKMSGHSDAVQCVAFGQGYLVSGGTDCTFRLWQ